MSLGSTSSPSRSALDVSLLIIRVVVGVIFFAHGAQKLFGMFGGPGLSKIVELMGPIGYLVAIGECLGGAGIVVGFLSRFSAASNIVIMLGAIAMVHGRTDGRAAAETARKTFESGEVGETLPSVEIPRSELEQGLGVLTAFVRAGLVSTTSDARPSDMWASAIFSLLASQ